MRHSGTTARRPACPDMPRPRAVSAGGGRCWVRTNVGLADGFTDRSSQTIGIVDDLVKLASRPREYPAPSAICPYARMAETAAVADGHGQRPQEPHCLWICDSCFTSLTAPHRTAYHVWTRNSARVSTPRLAVLRSSESRNGSKGQVRCREPPGVPCAGRARAPQRSRDPPRLGV